MYFIYPAVLHEYRPSEVQIRSSFLLVFLAFASVLVAPAAAQQEPTPSDTTEVADTITPGQVAADTTRDQADAADGAVDADADADATDAAEEPVDREKWDVAAEFNYNDQSGNRVLRLLSAALNFSHLEKSKFEMDGRIETRYGESDGETVALNHRATLGFDLRPEGRWSPFLSAEAEHDRIKQLDIRISGGAGAKFTPYRAADGDREFSVSLAVVASYEAYDEVPSNVEHRADQLRGRWSLRVRGQQQLRDGVTARHVTQYQPVWDELASYLLRTQTGVRVVLTERLALSVEYQWDRDSRPPDDVSPDDRVLKTGILIEF